MNRSTSTDDEGIPALGSRPLRPLRRQKTAVAVAQRIVEEISHSKLRPGTMLLPERDMLVRYQVARGSLRESLRFLEMNGVITIKPGPGGGPIVAEPDAGDLASTLGLFLEMSGTSFGSIMEVREALEPAVAGLAAERQQSQIIDQIGQSVGVMAGSLNNSELFLQENERFHHLVAVASGNPVFVLLLGSLERIIDGSRLGVSFSQRRRTAVLAAHTAIWKAIAVGEGEEASAEMRRHVQAFRQYTYKHYPQAEQTPLRWSDIAP